MDWRPHYDAIYGTLGVAAVLTLDGTDADFDITVMDKTVGVTLHEGPGVDTIRPAAAARMYELSSNGIVASDLNGGEISFNGRSWRIESHIPRPAPTGEDEGEVWMVLIERSATA